MGFLFLPIILSKEKAIGLHKNIISSFHTQNTLPIGCNSTTLKEPFLSHLCSDRKWLPVPMSDDTMTSPENNVTIISDLFESDSKNLRVVISQNSSDSKPAFEDKDKEKEKDYAKELGVNYF